MCIARADGVCCRRTPTAVRDPICIKVQIDAIAVRIAKVKVLRNPPQCGTGFRQVILLCDQLHGPLAFSGRVDHLGKLGTDFLIAETLGVWEGRVRREAEVEAQPTVAAPGRATVASVSSAKGVERDFRVMQDATTLQVWARA